MDKEDYTTKPIYIFGTGIVLGVIGTFSVLIFLVGHFYIKHDQIKSYLESQDKIVIDSNEYERLIKGLSKDNNLEGLDSVNLTGKWTYSNGNGVIESTQNGNEVIWFATWTPIINKMEQPHYKLHLI